MSKRSARKILTLVTSIAASAGAAQASPTTPLKPPASWTAADRSLGVAMIDGQPYLVAVDTVPVRLSYEEYGRYLGETQPLVGPDGRPGCGNILSKTSGDCTTARVHAVAKRVAAAKTDKQVAAQEADANARATWRADEAARVVAQAKRAK